MKSFLFGPNLVFKDRAPAPDQDLDFFQEELVDDLPHNPASIQKAKERYNANVFYFYLFYYFSSRIKRSDSKVRIL